MALALFGAFIFVSRVKSECQDDYGGEESERGRRHRDSGLAGRLGCFMRLSPQAERAARRDETRAGAAASIILSAKQFVSELR